MWRAWITRSGFRNSVSLSDPGASGAAIITALGAGNVSYSLIGGQPALTFNGNNLNVSAWDFSARGGFQCYVTGASITFVNCKFNAYTETANIDYNGGAGTITIKYCEFAITLWPSQSAIWLRGSGTGSTILVEYNWFHNSVCDPIFFSMSYASATGRV